MFHLQLLFRTRPNYQTVANFRAESSRHVCATTRRIFACFISVLCVLYCYPLCWPCL